MKNEIIVLVCLILCTSIIFAQQQGVQKQTIVSIGKNTSSENNQTPVQIQTNTQTSEKNKEQTNQIQQTHRIEVKTGHYTIETGQQIQVREQQNNKLEISSKETTVQTGLELSTNENNKLELKLSNGLHSELKIMPDTASETAIQALKLNVCTDENNCQIELKEVGQGEQIQAAYEVKAQKQVKVLGLFKTQMQVQAQVNAENGEIIKTEKPWWAFLVTDSE